MADMMRAYGMSGMDMGGFGADETLTLNLNNQLVKYILNNKDSEKSNMFCEQLYDLAVLANRPLNPEEMTRFVNRSNAIMTELAK